MNSSAIEKIVEKLISFFKSSRLYFAVSFVVGILTYGFCFSNKLEQMDDLACMFYTGASMSSGRWGLDITKHFLPSYSIPWLNGLLSVFLLSVSICLIIKLFKIRSKILSVLLAAIIISFPSQTVTFGYMYTSTHYAFAVLLTVVAVYLLCNFNNCRSFVIASILFVFSLSIYQAYIALAVSLFLVFIIYLCISTETPSKKIWLCGLRYILSLCISAILYFVLTFVLMKLTSTAFNSYAESSMSGGFLHNLRVAYTSFIGYFYKGYYDLISTPVSQIAHIVVAALIIILLTISILKFRKTDINRSFIIILCLILFPLGVNCVRVISSQFHNVMLLSFVSVYVLACIVLDCSASSVDNINTFNICKDFTAIAMFVVICTNVSFANNVYLKMFFQLEEAKSFYTNVATVLSETPGYDENTTVAIVGTAGDNFFVFPYDTSNLAGIREGLINIYSRGCMFQYFTGINVNIASDDLLVSLSQDADIQSMPQYPFYGSMKMFDNNIFVVNLG